MNVLIYLKICLIINRYDPEKVEEGLVKLVLTLVELIRQLLVRQALRRIESGSLSPHEIERLGLTLMKLEEKMEELKEHFGIDDLNINLGPLGNLID
jgi:hypothetical protein